LWSFAAALCFTICNEAISEITQEAGPLCLFYFATGAAFTGLVYQFVMASKNACGKDGTGVFWHDQKLMFDGKLDCHNFIGYLAFCFNYFLI
jgi:hypothetical protein